MIIILKNKSVQVSPLRDGGSSFVGFAIWAILVLFILKNYSIRAFPLSYGPCYLTGSSIQVKYSLLISSIPYLHFKINNSTIQQFNKSTITQFNDYTITRLHDSTITRFNDSTITQLHNYTITFTKSLNPERDCKFKKKIEYW